MSREASRSSLYALRWPSQAEDAHYAAVGLEAELVRYQDEPAAEDGPDPWLGDFGRNLAEPECWPTSDPMTAGTGRPDGDKARKARAASVETVKVKSGGRARGGSCTRCSQTFRFESGRAWHLENRPNCVAESRARVAA